MGYTGYKVIQYIDDNPNSATYGETWTEKVLDTTKCPSISGHWETISDVCERDTSGYTGNRITTYYNSATGEYSSTTEYDESCIASTTEEIWVATGVEYCEQENGANTGYKIQIQKQTNSNLANYGETREYRYASPDCTAAGTSCAVWDEITRSCHIILTDCNLAYDGSADVVQIDSNPISSTFNQTRTINVEDSGCSNCTDTTFAYQEVGDYCGYDVCESGLTEDSTPTNLYTISQKYKTISGTSYPMGEFLVTLKEEESEDCGYIRPRYRWVETDIRICVGYDLYGVEKEQVSYDLGETYADYFVDGQLVTRETAEPIATDVYTCGYPMERWVDTDTYVCSECETSEYRWTPYPIEEESICIDTDLYYIEKLETRCDGGEWEEVFPLKTRTGDLYEADTPECGGGQPMAYIYGENDTLLESVECSLDRLYTYSKASTHTRSVKKIVISGCTRTVGTVLYYGSKDGTRIDDAWGVTEIIIGDGVKTISSNFIFLFPSQSALQYFPLTSVTIGSGVTYIADNAIRMENGTNVSIYLTSPTPPVPQTSWNSSFSYVRGDFYNTGHFTFYVPEAYREAYENADIPFQIIYY